MLAANTSSALDSFGTLIGTTGAILEVSRTPL